MAANFGFIVHTAKRNTDKFASEGTSDGFAERGFAHARRSDKAENRALHSRLQFFHSQIIENALFHFFEIVVILIQDVLRLRNVDFRRPRRLAPRQGSHPLKICARNHVLCGSRRHFCEALQFAVALFLCFRSHLRFFDFFAQLVDFLL